MGTPFQDIYKIFLSQITSYSLLDIVQQEDGEDLLDENLQEWLMKACVMFSVCRQNLNDFSEEGNGFEANLSLSEKQILGHFMLLSYLNTYVLDENLLRQKLNSRDYRQYSEQGLVRAINDTKRELDTDAEKLLSRYSWSFENIREKFKNG